MHLWRITRAAYQRLDGEGARLYGGRWNSEGHAVVYTASTASLAVLELLVHVDVEDLPTDLVLLQIEVPAGISVREVGVAELAEDWTSTADHPDCVRLGDEWVSSRETLLLKVPSAVMPRESNYLINRAHPEAARVSIVGSERYSLDPRLFR